MKIAQASFLHPFVGAKDGRVIRQELTMLKSLGFCRVAVALAASFFLGSLLTLGMEMRSIVAAPAEPEPGALQGESAQPSSIPEPNLIQPQDLAKILQSPKGERPLLIYVGFRLPYTQAHIPGSEYHGPAANPAVVQQLQKHVEGLARNRFVVVYCGCCPWSHCPNVKPAYQALRDLGFTKLKVLYIPDNLGADWVNKGYPVEKGE
jgi:rhodanese-related sulfurtransferase